MTYYEHVKKAAEAVHARIPQRPTVGVVLGSGLSAFGRALHAAEAIPYDAIAGWPVPDVAGHEGQLIVGTINGCSVMALSGRVHAYEGFDLRAVTFGVRVARTLGVRQLMLTNAAGGINPRFAPGTLVLLDDHLNLTGRNPLEGPNDDRFGPRFPDMSEPYSSRLRELAALEGTRLGLSVDHGVYAWVVGPSYETPAEIRFLKTIGADLVGMSTVPEAIVARHMGMDVLGISCVTNPAAGLQAAPLRHSDVLDVAGRAGESCAALLSAVIARL